MRRFRLMNIDDMADELAEGVQFSDGTVAVRRGMGTVAYLAVEIVEEDQRAYVQWIDRADVVIGYVATEDGPALRCLTHPFLGRPHRDLMESELKGEERFLCGVCRRQLEEVYLERRGYVEEVPLPVQGKRKGLDSLERHSKWLDSLVIGWRPDTWPGPRGVRCLHHPYEIISASPITRTDLQDAENCSKLGCGYNLRNHLSDPGALSTREQWLEKLHPVDLDTLVIGYRATRSPGFVPLLRCLSHPFVVTVAKRITRTDLPDGGNCGRCGVDLLAFLDEPARLCTLDRWEQVRTAEPPEYREHVAGCTKLYYHPDACWPVEG